MNKPQNYFLIVSIFFIGLLGCNNGDKYSAKNEDGSIPINEFTIREGKKIDPNEWKCYEVQYDRICCPRNWHLSKQQKRLFLVSISDVDTNSYFTVVRYDQEANNLSSNDYLRALYSRLVNDTVEQLIKYTLKETKFKDKTTYYGEFETEINKTKYISYSMVINYNGLLYDIALKCPEQFKDMHYEDMENIYYNYRANGQALFSEKNPPLSFKEIDMSKL